MIQHCSETPSTISGYQGALIDLPGTRDTRILRRIVVAVILMVFLTSCRNTSSRYPQHQGSTASTMPQSLQEKLQQLHALVEKRQEETVDIAPIGILMLDFDSLVQEKKFDQAEALLDRALRLAVKLKPTAPEQSALLKMRGLRAFTGPASSSSFQPLMDEARSLEAALDFLGQPLAPPDREKLNAAFASRDTEAAVEKLEAILDRYTLAVVTISPESRVDVQQGIAAPDLIQGGARLFLVKVVNLAGVTAPLAVESPNNGPVYVPSSGSPEPAQHLTLENVRDRWADISLLHQPPLSDERLSGLPLEYRLLEISSRDSGQRTATLSFNVGQGSQDVGFLNQVSVLFKIAPAHSIRLHVMDADGKPTTASFIFQDNLGRLYPNPIKRLAPDFYFQPQVYRSDGESIQLPPGSYTVTYSGGPEFIAQTKKFSVTDHTPTELSFHLERWIDPEKYGYYSGDDHIHAAGCAHYENPSEGVGPKDMDRQVLGEHLNVGAVLVWGPCFYFQSSFFRGREDNSVSTSDSLLHYDLEVSGFPSSHAGHLVLMNLNHIMYPGTKTIGDWPTWDLPVLQWAKSQGALAGYAHSGWGLAVGTQELPNYVIPGFDSIGANEYIVDVTYPHTVDFISLGDTPYVWELNIWYQTLNIGFRTRISGETDFPCIYDQRIGEGRTYVKISGQLTYDGYVKAIQTGAAYASDGRSHLMDFKVDGTEVGTNDSQVNLAAPQNVNVTVTAAAYLPATPNPSIDKLPYDQRPYWDLERSRIGNTRKVPVEVVMNGQAVAKSEIVADGSIRKLNFSVPIVKSGWIAVRILPSSHTDPVFVLVGGKPIRASRRSAEWCLRCVDQCWTQKAPKISAKEMPEAKKAYDHAREVYRTLIRESGDE